MQSFESPRELPIGRLLTCETPDGLDQVTARGAQPCSTSRQPVRSSSGSTRARSPVGRAA
jgi:hypothetical protein